MTYEEKYSYQENNMSYWLIIGLLVGLVWSLFFNKPRHEGRTANEWFYSYSDEFSRHQELKDCIENYYKNPEDLYYNCM